MTEFFILPTMIGEELVGTDDNSGVCAHTDSFVLRTWSVHGKKFSTLTLLGKGMQGPPVNMSDRRADFF